MKNYEFILQCKRGFFWKFWREFFYWIIDSYEMRKYGYELVISKEWNDYLLEHGYIRIEDV